MIFEFRVENYRSFRDPQEFVTERWSSHISQSVKQWPHPDYSPVAAIFGPNASGKSTFIRALDFLRKCVAQSVVRWDIDEGIPRSPFSLDKRMLELPTRMEIVFAAGDGVRYQYMFAVDDETVLEETLWAYYTQKRRKLFSREGSKITSWHRSLSGPKGAVEEMLINRPNALLLSAAAQLGNASIEAPFLWLARKIRTTNARHASFIPVFVTIANRIERDESFAAKFRALLKSSDLGISDVEVIDDLSRFLPGDQSDGGGTPRKTIRFLHSADGLDMPLPLHEESDGTRSMITFALLVLDVLSDGGVWAVDEIDSSLHPLLVAELIDLFQDPVSNPKQAQLILTTHDVSLLGRSIGGQIDGLPLIQRDQFWVMEKDSDGASSLIAVQDFQPRAEDNLERRYLSGRYGGVPRLTLKNALTSCEPAADPS